MEYVSTRGLKGFTFGDAVLEGLAADGGLIVPKAFPKIDAATQREWSKLSYCDLALEIFKQFIPASEIPHQDLTSIVRTAYRSNFRAPDCVTIRTLLDFPSDGTPRSTQTTDSRNQQENRVGSDTPAAPQCFLLELDKGPTFAFKDYALQFLGLLFRYLLTKRKRKATILGATSGDTGSAAIAGFRGLDNIACVILFPKDRVSRVQRMQMTTVEDSNVHCLGVDGTFDDCQNIVKACFNDEDFKLKMSLGAVNSINFARIMAQVVYHWYAALKVVYRRDQLTSGGDTDAKQIDMVVPTGNFGNVLSGHYARRMGAPIRRAIIATNCNDLLVRFTETGKYTLTEVQATMSSSMDILISSNFERFFYEACGSDPDLVKRKFGELKTAKSFDGGEEVLKCMQENFCAFSASEDETTACIQRYAKSSIDGGKDLLLLDPHTAVGFVVLEKYLKEQRAKMTAATADGRAVDEAVLPCVTMATAHFGKFPDAVCKSLALEHNGQRVVDDPHSFVATRTPPELSTELTSKSERFTPIEADCELVKEFVRSSVW